ncbi:MFS transporter [Ktedonobacteria bacterium brp13]|nr:MFS transporter [Ktedonobacteria bacterium brp13]
MALETQESEITGILAASGSTQHIQERPVYTQREKLLTMSGVLLVMLLASLDQTIMDTAMPKIISDLNGFNLYTWVTTAYLLTSTVMVPIYGKLSDLFGRKPLFLTGVVIFLIGSAASGASQSMQQLVAFRALQGLGAAALMPIAIAVIGDLFSARERGKWQGVTGAVFGLSAVIGPALGGWITDNTSWRWVFYVNVPVGIVALFVLVFLMPTLKSQFTGRARIDYLGAVLLIGTTVPFLLGLSWGGANNQYPWLSWQIISLFVAAAVFLVLFIVYERRLEARDAQPIIDPSLFTNPIFTVSVLITSITSMGMFGCIVFLPLFSQGVLGISATNSGVRLIPLMGGLIFSSIISGQLVSRTGKYKLIAFAGMVITIGGSFLLQQLDVHSTPTELVLDMIVLGVGLGFGMSIYTVIVQNAIPDKIGQATSGLTFFRSIGGTIAVAAMGSVLNSSYVPGFHNALPASLKAVIKPADLNNFNNPNVLLSPDTQSQLHRALAPLGPLGNQIYGQLFVAVKIGLTDGIHNVFILSTAVMCVGFLLLFFLKEIPLSTTKREQVKVDAVEDASANSVVAVTME